MRLTLFSKLIFCAVLASAHAGHGDEAGERQSLRILVYGATGKVGTHVVDEALARGHVVTAVSRNPLTVKQRHPNLVAVRGDLLDPENVKQRILAALEADA